MICDKGVTIMIRYMYIILVHVIRWNFREVRYETRGTQLHFWSLCTVFNGVL